MLYRYGVNITCLTDMVCVKKYNAVSFGMCNVQVLMKACNTCMLCKQRHFHGRTAHLQNGRIEFFE